MNLFPENGFKRWQLAIKSRLNHLRMTTEYIVSHVQGEC